MIEIERKYTIDKNSAEQLKKKALKRIGIIQWYLTNKKNEIERIRLQIIKENVGLIKKWKYAYKANTNIPHEKIEEEKDYIQQDLKELFNKEMVIKVRYIIRENPEIVLDEFVEIEGLKYNIKEKNLLEIEMKETKKYTKKDFEEILKKEKIKILRDVTEDYKYYNNNIANKLEKSKNLDELIEVLKWKI
ncbi:hypothetical protein SAMN02745164_01049 [Marinitoga hydrogenitolerans DSM 16785]|uniref:CYTH domain-containing protein n=1 Tax=Marinitoga hydrogenitolerans (strain DSM 16785 / JCM 12826 / AT1271) TaxID=1122195 RepID=A0A1M4VZG8_MARH1|nr:hypothetical protein [Marinitoga hydrogenitolerans]SHE74290.1 hypothetical protein SAMN02745164_01049 [Marinitoga hydrogenitolerans DSM 16785]